MRDESDYKQMQKLVETILAYHKYYAKIKTNKNMDTTKLSGKIIISGEIIVKQGLP